MSLHLADGLELPDELVTQPCAILDLIERTGELRATDDLMEGT